MTRAFFVIAVLVILSACVTQQEYIAPDKRMTSENIARALTREGF